MFMKPSGKVELLIITQMPPFFASKATKGRAPHIVALLGSTFHAANIRLLLETSKPFAQKTLIPPNKYLFIFG